MSKQQANSSSNGKGGTVADQIGEQRKQQTKKREKQMPIQVADECVAGQGVDQGIVDKDRSSSRPAAGGVADGEIDVEWQMEKQSAI